MEERDTLPTIRSSNQVIGKTRLARWNIILVNDVQIAYLTPFFDASAKLSTILYG